jgi:hypothetical protein
MAVAVLYAARSSVCLCCLQITALHRAKPAADVETASFAPGALRCPRCQASGSRSRRRRRGARCPGRLRRARQHLDGRLRPSSCSAIQRTRRGSRRPLVCTARNLRARSRDRRRSLPGRHPPHEPRMLHVTRRACRRRSTCTPAEKRSIPDGCGGDSEVGGCGAAIGLTALAVAGVPPDVCPCA